MAACHPEAGELVDRTQETKSFADAMKGWYDQLVASIKSGDMRTFDRERWDPGTWPGRTGKG